MSINLIGYTTTRVKSCELMEWLEAWKYFFLLLINKSHYWSFKLVSKKKFSIFQVKARNVFICNAIADPRVVDQAVARSHRPKQEGKVTVTSFRAPETFEMEQHEKMLKTKGILEEIERALKGPVPSKEEWEERMSGV